MLTEDELSNGFSLGDCEILPGEGVVIRGDERISPEPQTWRVLIALAKRDGQLVSRDDLIKEVWGGRAVSDDPINRAIREVRKCFGDSAKDPRYVATLHKRGYRLLHPVRLLKPAGEDKTEADNHNRDSRLRTPPWRSVGAILAIAMVAVAMYAWISRPPPVRSIVVMPFENLSALVEDEYLVSGFREELVTMLANIDDFTVKKGQVRYELETDEIAAKHGVESVLVGSLRRSGDALRINFLISTAEKGVVHSGVIEGNVSEAFSLQESLAVMVRDKLVGNSRQTLIKSRPSSSEAYDSYMRGMFALERRGIPGNLELASDLFRDAIQLDASYGPAYLGLATAYALMPDYRDAPLEDFNDLALNTIDRGVAADVEITNSAGAIYGFIRHKQKRWSESEQNYQRAIGASVVDSNAFNWYSRMLASVGRLDDALQQALHAIEIDPDSPVINSRIAMSYAWLMDTESSLKYYRRANELGWNGSTYLLSYAFVLIRGNEVEKARKRAIAGIEMTGGQTNWLDPVFAALADPTEVPNALNLLDAAYEQGSVLPEIVLMVRTLFGDLDGAIDVAILLEQPGEAFEMDLLFLPELRALREHRGFLPLLERLGVTDYWQANGCDWANDKVTCPES